MLPMPQKSFGIIFWKTARQKAETASTDVAHSNGEIFEGGVSGHFVEDSLIPVDFPPTTARLTGAAVFVVPKP